MVALISKLLACGTRVAAGATALILASVAVADVHINEVAMTTRGTQWVELHHPAAEDAKAQSLGGFVLTNEVTTKGKDDKPVTVGFRYHFPRSLPPVLPGAFVVVRFDGLGSEADTLTLDDKGSVLAATLHSLRKQVNPFSATDHVALYAGDKFSAESSRSFVAWGSAPGDAAAHAVEAGQWVSQTATIQFAADSDDAIPGPGAVVLDGDGTLGALNNVATPAPDQWSVYPSDSTTQGALNALPGVQLYLPPHEMGTGTGDVSFSWLAQTEGSTFHFQLAMDDRFTTLIADEHNLTAPFYDTLSTLSPATYYWRVRAVEGKRSPGPWSATRSFEVEAFVEDPQEEFEFIPDDGGAANDAPAVSTLTGLIKDARTGSPLSGVTVTLNPGALSAVTNAGGNYTIPNVANGAYTGTATLDNYNTLSGPVNLTGNATLNCSLKGKSHYAMRNGSPTPARKARKDTALLCVDGSAFTVPIVNATFISNPRSRCNHLATDLHGGATHHHWDGSHYSRAQWGRHEANHCPYAMTQMLNWYYGGTITQDEVSDWISVNDNAGNPWGFTTNPERGLRHDLGGWADKAVIWALNNAAVDQMWAKPTEAQIMGYIDADRPCGMVQCNGRNMGGACNSSHYMVLDGYYWANKRMYVRLLNTDNNGSVDPSRRYSTQDFFFDASQQAVNHRAALIVPAANSTGRATDPKVSTDSDGDGMMDYDEEFRFHTNKAAKDTDADKIADKVEVTSYIFPSPARPILFLHSARPEFTADSDGDGCKDGDEDLDRNGKFEVPNGETDPFSAASKDKPGDLNMDCLIDAVDFNMIWAAFGSHPGDGFWLPQADYNANNVIDLVDYQTWYGYYAQFSAPGP
jgi:hypothetical protein